MTMDYIDTGRHRIDPKSDIYGYAKLCVPPGSDFDQAVEELEAVLNGLHDDLMREIVYRTSRFVG